jgi:hypothetical protein
MSELREKETSSVRVKRVDEQRDRESRHAEILKNIQSTYSGDPLWVDPASIPYGYECHWGRESFLGRDDNARIIELKRKGWVYANPADYPQLSSYATQYEGIDRIHYRGMTLLQREIIYGRIERDMVQKEVDAVEKELGKNLSTPDPVTIRLQKQQELETNIRSNSYMYERIMEKTLEHNK